MCADCKHPFPHPLYPLEYWKNFSLFKEDQLRRLSHTQDHRDSITDVSYWRTEAVFWHSRAEDQNADRHSISSSSYWKCEAGFWEAACRSRRNDVARLEILDAAYWKCEAFFWKNIKSQNDLVDISAERHDISEVSYWMYENNHYENILRWLSSSTTMGGSEDSSYFRDSTMSTHEVISSLPEKSEASHYLHLSPKTSSCPSQLVSISQPRRSIRIQDLSAKSQSHQSSLSSRKEHPINKKPQNRGKRKASQISGQKYDVWQ